MVQYAVQQQHMARHQEQEKERRDSQQQSPPPPPPPPVTRTLSLARRFEGADPQALDLLHHMLEFQPQRRWTAAQCLAHPYFAPVRREYHRETTYAHVAHDPHAVEAGTACFCFQCTESTPLSFSQTKKALAHHVKNDNPGLEHEPQ
jgi:serine/threonine protein kinase